MKLLSNETMKVKTNLYSIGGWAFGTAVIIVGLLNVALVHVVPGVVYLILSLVYLPPSSDLLTKKLGFSIPLFIKVVMGVAIFFFTWGVSDLGDLID